jgi:hypothetical protein
VSFNQTRWCLFEIGATPPHKLHLVTRGFSERDIAEHLQNIDAETALCFSDDDRKMIHAEITERFEFGTLARFTEELRLRFLLRPVSYDVEVAALRQRSSGDVFDFEALRDHLEAPAAVPHAGGESMRLACVVGEAGEGKSTLSAALFGGDFVHAAHFCTSIIFTFIALSARILCAFVYLICRTTLIGLSVYFDFHFCVLSMCFLENSSLRAP